MADSNSTKARIPAVDLNREIALAQLGNNFLGFLSSYVQTLPPYTDDIERDFGTDIYERMMRDSAVLAAIGDIQTAVLSEGVRFLNRIPSPSPAVADPQAEAKFERGEEICDWVKRVMDELQAPLEDTLGEMLDCLAYGHQVAEQTYEPRGGKLALKKLAVKPRAAYGFVVDEFMNHWGFVVAKPGSAGIISTALTNPEDIVAREKFFVLTNAPKCGDPRGRSILRAAYTCWWLKQQTWPNQLKFLAQFGTPSLKIIMPESGGSPIEVTDDEGYLLMDGDQPKTVSPEEAMLAKGLAFQNSSVSVWPFGTQVDTLQVASDGEAYIKAIDLYDRQMVRSIIYTTRTLMEAQFGSRADSNTAQDVTGRVTQLVRRKVEVGFYRDVLLPLVRYNFGDQVASEFCPVMVLSDLNSEDVIEYGNMIANLSRSNYLRPEQKPGIDAKLKLPERDFATEVADLEDERDRQAELAHRAYGLQGTDATASDDSASEE